MPQQKQYQTRITWVPTKRSMRFWSRLSDYIRDLEMYAKQNFFRERLFRKRFILAPVRIVIRKSINNIFISAVRILDNELLAHFSSGLVGLKGNKKQTDLCCSKDGKSISGKAASFVVST